MRKTVSSWIVSAVMVMTSLGLVSCDGDISSSEAMQYNEWIAERSNLLGQAIILQGRLLEGFMVNKDVLDEEQFIEAEELLADKLEQLSDSEPLPASLSSSESLKALHGKFRNCVSSISRSAQIVDEEAYVSRAVRVAELAWDDARQCFIEWTETLLRATGQENQIASDTDDGIAQSGMIEIVPAP